jgi:hypothetical protein
LHLEIGHAIENSNRFEPEQPKCRIETLRWSGVMAFEIAASL